MAELVVRRKAHKREPYVREGEVLVKGSNVKASTFKTKDMGVPGRTPKSKQWYDPKTETGWEKDMPIMERRERVLQAHGGDELASARAMQALANYTTDRVTRLQAKSDAHYFYHQHKLNLPARRNTQPRRPLRITPKQPKLNRYGDK